MTERVLTLLAPYIAVIAGAIADWGLVHLHFLHDFHDRDKVVAGITQIIVWALTAILVWISSQRWFHRLTTKEGDEQ